MNKLKRAYALLNVSLKGVYYRILYLSYTYFNRFIHIAVFSCRGIGNCYHVNSSNTDIHMGLLQPRTGANIQVHLTNNHGCV